LRWLSLREPYHVHVAEKQRDEKRASNEMHYRMSKQAFIIPGLL
jgi:hypothetical protein